MNEKFDIAQYLVNLMSIMEGKEDAGRAKGNTLADEYNRIYERLTGLIKTEQENARKSKLEQSTAPHADTESDRESGRGEPDRSSAG